MSLGPTTIDLTDWRGAQIAVKGSESAPFDEPRIWIQVREDGEWVAVELDEIQAMKLRDVLVSWMHERSVERARARAWMPS